MHELSTVAVSARKRKGVDYFLLLLQKKKTATVAASVAAKKGKRDA